ncbi:MerR family transcriptional regulator [Actinomadura sp. WMMB 499]|uniref:MerR family transcriptional regulator n=1 Tax=Actinomadura sp. WMMB 499 TaxID=1219491 RepID=UPI0012457B2D|nr:MerR family transcriptional regulator [Actinomadura sp. WMMB 499]QFG24307.1 MerR family transcriptional regulator [Actinomadura sp. WMMB 499]
MLIGELSRRTGVNAHQLRYYEAQGLLEAGRGANGYREYADGAVVTVTQIRRLLEAGLSTKEIEYLLPCATGSGPELEPCPELVEALRARLRKLDECIESVVQSRTVLSDLIDDAERRMPDVYPECGATDPEPAIA